MGKKNKDPLNLFTLWKKYILSEVKEITFLSFMEENKKNFFKVMVRNSSGGRDTILLEITCPLNKVGGKEYEYLLDVMKNKLYEKSL